MNARKVRKALCFCYYRSGSRHAAVVGPATHQSSTKVDAVASWRRCVRGHSMVSRSRYSVAEKQYSLSKEANCCCEPGFDRCRVGKVLACLQPLRRGLGQDLRQQNCTL